MSSHLGKFSFLKHVFKEKVKGHLIMKISVIKCWALFSIVSEDPAIVVKKE